MLVYLFVFCFNHRRIPRGSFPQNFVKIGLDLAEILRISKLDRHDGGGEEGEKKGRGGILLCNGLMVFLIQKELPQYICKSLNFGGKEFHFAYIFYKGFFLFFSG